MSMRKLLAFTTAAALVAGLAAEPALADSANPSTTQNSSAPAIAVNNTAPNTSTVTGASASNNNGNTALNSSAGTANQQQNAVIVTNGTGPLSMAASTTQNAGNATGPNGAASPLPNTGITDSAKATSTIGDNTAVNNSGAVGVNSAAGTGNLQANTVIVSNEPTAFATPTTTQNGGQGTVYQGAAATANVGGNVANAVNGAVGLNSAAGSLNAQSNTLYISTPPGNTAQPSEISNTINQSFNASGGANLTQAPDATATPPPGAVPPPGSGTPVNGNYSSASISGTAGASATGNIGINSAAGIANAQANSTNIVNGVTNTGGSLTANQFVTQTISAGSSPTPIPVTINVAPARNLSLTVSNTATIGSGTATPTPGPGDGIGGVGAFNATSGVQNAQSNAVTLIGGATTGSSVLQSIGQSTTVGEINRYASNSDTSSIDHAVNGVTGIAALNSSAGVQNAQANALTFVSGGTGAGAAVSQTISSQTISNPGNDAIGGNGGVFTAGTMHSEVGTATGSPAVGTTGIAAINSAAGTANQQYNSAYSGLQNAASSSTQGGQQQYTGGASGGLVETKLASTYSVIHGNTGQGSNGAVLLNSAAGVANAQSNAMALLNGSTSGNSAQQHVLQSASGGAAMNADVTSQPTNFASVGQNTGQGVSGYVAANTTSGLANQQANQMTVMSGATGGVPNSPAVNQSISSSDVAIQGGTNTAAIGGATSNAFSGSSGVVAVNSSAGVLNQQANVILVTTGSLADTAPSPTQNASVTMTGTGTSTNSASIGGNTFSGNTGSIGANVAAGVANQQANIVQIGGP